MHYTILPDSLTLPFEIENPFKGTILLSDTGSGKTSLINELMKQLVGKGNSICVYDNKSPDLLHPFWDLLDLQRFNLTSKEGPKPTRTAILFRDARLSSRHNPIAANRIDDLVLSSQSARILLLNLNSTWSAKQHDIFVEASLKLVTAGLELLKEEEKNTKDEYCSVPHLIELFSLPSQQLFSLFSSRAEHNPAIRSLTQPFIQDVAYAEHWDSIVFTLSKSLIRLKSDDLYWIMTGSDTRPDLAINDPASPGHLYIGDSPANPSLKAVCALYMSQLYEGINQSHRLPTAVICDGADSMYLNRHKGLMNIPNAHQVSCIMAYSSLYTLMRTMGEREAKAFLHGFGNIFIGRLDPESASLLPDLLDEKLHLIQSLTTDLPNFTFAGMVASQSKDREYSFMGKIKVSPPNSRHPFSTLIQPNKAIQPKLDEGEFEVAKTENRERIVNAIQQLR